ncbi:hypothetical protein [Chitinophaga sp.]|uniref:hypothetical protein n=1 Tax=Chitinophaga sp. TaxID=1869181 RepID=UPI0031E0C8EE
MFFVFGTKYLGGVKSYNNQEIQTKFFHFCFMPLFPVEGESLLVTESGWNTRKGIYLKQNGTSILAGYGRMWILGLAAATFFLGKASDSILWMIVGLALGAFAVYLFISYGKSTAEENAEREVIGSLTGIYAVAEWLPDNVCDSIFNRMRAAYQAEGRNWQEDIRTGNVMNPKVAYALALLNYAYLPGEELWDLRVKAAELYAASQN